MLTLTSRICSLLCIAVIGVGCRGAEELHQREVLDALIARGTATRADVERELGKGDLYEKGTPGWTHLESMSRGRAQGQLRDMLPKYPKILYTRLLGT